MAAVTGVLRRFLFGESLEERSWPYGVPPFFSAGGITYPLTMPPTSLSSKQEAPDPSFKGYAQEALQANAIVFACNQARMRLFAEARFQFRQLRSGRPGDLFGTEELAILET